MANVVNPPMARTEAIVALDVASAAAALELASRLDGVCSFFKVGGELFTSAGPEVVTRLIEKGNEVFLDLKFHDIPNTVAGAVRSAAALGARLLTVHASGGSKMVRAAVDAAGDPERCGILAVTVLTSLTSDEVASAWGRSGPVDVRSEVLRLAELAQGAGAHGVVCSGQEAAVVREQWGERLETLVPGVRLAGGATQDQARVVTPAEAARAGARYVVLGRAVTGAADPRAAMSEALSQLGANARK
jgi:orotidine-5'-phosphate decarboxylase